MFGKYIWGRILLLVLRLVFWLGNRLGFSLLLCKCLCSGFRCLTSSVICSYRFHPFFLVRSPPRFLCFPVFYLISPTPSYLSNKLLTRLDVLAQSAAHFYWFLSRSRKQGDNMLEKKANNELGASGREEIGGNHRVGSQCHWIPPYAFEHVDPRKIDEISAAFTLVFHFHIYLAC